MKRIGYRIVFPFPAHTSGLFIRDSIRVIKNVKVLGSATYLFPMFLLFCVVLSASSYAGTYYYKNENGIPVYTNIPPGEKGYKRIVLPEEQTRSRSSRSRLGAFSYSDKYDADIYKTATWYGIDPSLVKAIIKVESNFNPKAISPKGAMGVMQLMPGTARDYGVGDPFDPSENIEGGVKYLRKLMGMFNDNLELALAGYNAGENAVMKYGYKIPPYAETIDYVQKVLSHYSYLRNKSSIQISEKIVEAKNGFQTGGIPQAFGTNGELVLVSAPETLAIEPWGVGKSAKSQPLISTLDSGGKFTIQVASYPEIQKAEEMKEHLKSKLYPAYIQKVELPGKGTWYRVRVGSFRTEKEAAVYGDAIKNIETEIESVLVVTLSM